MSEYNRYLKSEHWRDLRTRKLAQCPWCEGCSTKENRQVHHLRYKQLFDCELSDLMTLCDSCHKDMHLAQENLGWSINNSHEAISMLHYFRSLSVYAETRDKRPTGVKPMKKAKNPHGRFKNQVDHIMAQYRRMRVLTPNDVREMVCKLQNLLAANP